MTWLKKVRIEESKKRPVLKDIRALYHDDIGVSVRVLRLIESDPHFLAKPEFYARIILYFQNEKLLDEVCIKCPINDTVKNILRNPNERCNEISKYNKEFNKLHKIKKLVKSRKREKYIFQNSRLRFSLEKNRFYSIEDLSRMTFIPIKKLIKIEKKNYMIDNLEEINVLLSTYRDTILAKKICEICPVKHAEDDMLKNINKEEEI